MHALSQGSLTEGEGSVFSTVDLLVLISRGQLHFILNILFNFFTEQATLIRRPTVPSLPPQLVFRGKVILNGFDISRKPKARVF